MLSIDKKWIADGDKKVKNAEYRKIDFYGPFLTLRLEQSKDDEDDIINVIPISERIETPEISENGLKLLAEATQELYRILGTFKLKTNLFDVVINSEKTEELLLNEIALRLF